MKRQLPVTYLYVPGDRPDRFHKALGAGSGAVVFDLEDAVDEPAKDAARSAVVRHLGIPADRTQQWVRVNSGAAGLEDLAAVVHLPGLTGIVVPKANRSSLAQVKSLTPAPCVALVESAESLLEIEAIASAENVVAVACGEVDLAADLGIEPSGDERELWPLRMLVVVACAASGRQAIGPVFTQVTEADGLRESTSALRRAGFRARQAIHPSQVPHIVEAMAPSQRELDNARRVLRLARLHGAGAHVDTDGGMIDQAVVRRARGTLGLP